MTHINLFNYSLPNEKWTIMIKWMVMCWGVGLMVRLGTKLKFLLCVFCVILVVLFNAEDYTKNKQKQKYNCAYSHHEQYSFEVTHSKNLGRFTENGCWRLSIPALRFGDAKYNLFRRRNKRNKLSSVYFDMRIGCKLNFLPYVWVQAII